MGYEGHTRDDKRQNIEGERQKKRIKINGEDISEKHVLLSVEQCVLVIASYYSLGSPQSTNVKSELSERSV